MTVQLPSLPARWSRTRVDRVATVNARIGWKALTAAEYQSEGYAFLSTPNIKGREIDFSNVNYISKFRYEESPELKLRPGDVLLAKDGNTLGIVNIVRDLPRPATVNGSIAVIRSTGINPSYLRHVLASRTTQETINMLKGGMGVPHLFQWDINRLPIPLPPLEEQRRIADFLDIETARIDSLSTARDAQVRCLEELWVSRLAHRVELWIATHGLVPLRRVVESIEQGWSPQCDDTIAAPSEWAVLKTSAVSSGTFKPMEHKKLPHDISPDLRYQITDGDILMTRGSGSPEHVGIPAVAHPAGRQLLLSDLLYRIRLSHHWSSEFTSLVLKSQPVRGFMALLFRGQSGQTIKLRADDIRSIDLPAVPAHLQEQYAADLTKERQALYSAVAALRKSSALLAERRQALITAAVTGQIDVSTAGGRGIEE